MRDLGEARGALLATTGESEPKLFEDLDPARVGKARMVDLAKEGLRVVNGKLTNWSGMAFPNPGWAETIFGEPDVERLWDAVAYATRLDEPDPAAAWNKHMTRLEHRARELNELELDRLRYARPGTELEIGLLPESRFGAARFTTEWGRSYVPNMPTEEVFTTPTRAGRRAGSARRDRSSSPARPWSASSSSSREGARCASRPRPARTWCAARSRATNEPPSSARSRS